MNDNERNSFTFKKYQQACHRTAVYHDAIDTLTQDMLPNQLPSVDSEEFSRIAMGRAKVEKFLQLSYVGLGLGEAGEFQNKLKKVLRDGNGIVSDEMRAGLRKELGGLLWYVAQCCTELGLDMGEVAEENTKILASRKERGVLKGSGDDR